MADVVTLWSKTADFSSAVAAFPNLCDKSLYDTKVAASSTSDLYGTNGGYIQSDNTDSTTLTYTDTDNATLTMTSTAGIIVGMYVYIDDLSAGSNVDGYYRIENIDSGTQITFRPSGILSGPLIDTNDTCSFYIGGVSDAFDSSTTLQDELDFIGPAAGADPVGGAINNLDILCHASTATAITTKIDIDSISGSTTTRVRLIGSDSDFIPDSANLLEITTATDLTTNGLFDFADASDWTNWYNFDFNAGGKDSNLGGYGVVSQTTSSTDHLFVNCDFHGAEVSGCHYHGVEWTFINCNFYENGTMGLELASSRGGDSSIKACKFYDNDSDGFFGGGLFVAVENCKSWGNGGNGFTFNLFMDGSHIYNNTSFNNTGDGFQIDDVADGCRIANNSSYSNTGVGYDLQGGAVQPISFFGNNHSNSNSSHYSEGSDSTFADFSGGNNITTAPQFTSETPGQSGFLQPASTSPLIDAGVGGTGDTIGALCATAGAGGGVMPLTGLLS
jgi:hypothetical protein